MGGRYGTLLEHKLDVADGQACLDQVERLTRSPILEGSEGLCRLIRFLAEHSLNSPTEHLKEYQIATEGLGRPAGFDPHSDASVRVQMGRLREKLNEYYCSTGASDPIVVELPKGKYTLSFRSRPAPEPAVRLVETKPPAKYDPLLASLVGRPGKSFIILVGLLTILLCAGLGTFLWRRHVASHEAHVVNAAPPSTALATFWKPFAHSPDQPIVVFKNLGFVGDDAVGMRRYDPTRDNPNQEIQSFTGVGEVMGIVELDRLFDQLGGTFRPKRDGLFTIDDARHNELIFLGSPSRAISLSEMPGTSEFTFQRVGPNRYRWGIVDKRRKPGEMTGVYPGSFGPQTVVTDYAIVALKKGLDPTRWTLFLEGTSTVATQAAVDFVCDEDSVRDLLRRLNVGSDGNLKPFESLLRVKIANNVPVGSELLDFRETSN
jgi:hypothetical protein